MVGQEVRVVDGKARTLLLNLDSMPHYLRMPRSEEWALLSRAVCTLDPQCDGMHPINSSQDSCPEGMPYPRRRGQNRWGAERPSVSLFSLLNNIGKP